MDKVGAQSIKYAYQQTLIEEGQVEKAAKLAKKDLYDPIYETYNVHPEEEPIVKDLNSALTDIGIDFLIINKEIAAAGQAYADMMADMKLRLDAVDQQLLIEEERLKDLNILCSNFTEFDKVVTLTKDNFEGNFSVENGRTFMAYANSLKDVKLSVIKVSGNGYEGNEYVMANGAFLKNSIDTSKQERMVDSSLITAYEYSRLTADSSEVLYPPAVNFDSEEAQCSIAVRADEMFNTIKLVSDFSNIVITDILISKDKGATFTSVSSDPIEINNLDAKYESGAYAYGSGVICFPDTQYLKLVLKSGGSTTDTIAFKNVDTSDASSPRTTTVVLNSARRHVIRINNIQARAGNFSTETAMHTGELIDAPVESIAIFANEYVPKHFPQGTYFKYVLNVNGVDYNIVPINSQRNGTKVIRTSDYNAADDYVKHISESIKTASLTAVICAPNSSETPYLSNVKICYGKVETKSV